MYSPIHLCRQLPNSFETTGKTVEWRIGGFWTAAYAWDRTVLGKKVVLLIPSVILLKFCAGHISELVYSHLVGPLLVLIMRHDLSEIGVKDCLALSTGDLVEFLGVVPIRIRLTREILPRGARAGADGDEKKDGALHLAVWQQNVFTSSTDAERSFRYARGGEARSRNKQKYDVCGTGFPAARPNRQHSLHPHTRGNGSKARRPFFSMPTMKMDFLTASALLNNNLLRSLHRT
jgi:hypothetical protein